MGYYAITRIQVVAGFDMLVDRQNVDRKGSIRRGRYSCASPLFFLQLQQLCCAFVAGNISLNKNKEDAHVTERRLRFCSTLENEGYENKVGCER